MLSLTRLSSMPPRVVALAVAGVAAVAIVVAGAAALSHSGQSELFATPLHPEQLQEVEERLAGWNVAFVPRADNVDVEASRRNELLLRLSLAGVPHAHLATEDEALAGVGALTPQSVIDAQALDGREGDIASSLRDVAGVQDARVIIAPARSGEFADENSSPTSASVRLRLEPGVRPSGETIAGIRAFVAAAVPGLSASRVTILDDRGVALDDAETAAADGEIGLQSALQSALDAAFGAGSTIVRVHAGDRDETSTAVFVDESHAADLPAVRDLAAAAVGFDAQRGDALVVQTVGFARAPAARKDVWWLLYGGIVPLLPTLACVLGALVAVRMVLPAATAAVRAATERFRIADARRSAPEMAPARVRAMLATEPPHAAAAVISALPAATAAAVLELFPPHERAAIVRRMHREPPPLIPDPRELLRNG